MSIWLARYSVGFAKTKSGDDRGLGASDIRDRENRTFTVSRPNALWVASLSYVVTRGRPAYVAFAIDAFA